MGTFLSLLGLALQLIGGVVALWGLVKTHDSYAEKTLRVIVTERLTAFRDRVERIIWRLLRRPKHQTIVVGGIDGIGMVGDATVTITWGPLPAKTPDALRELDRRTRDLSTRIDGLDHRLRDVTNEQRASLGSLRDELTKAQQEAQQLVRNAAIEGLMTEAVGLVLVTAGAILQGWGSFAS